MEHLEIAKSAVKQCYACRKGLPLVMYPRSPERSCDLAHFDPSHNSPIFFCDASEYVEPLITGYSGEGDRFPVLEDGYDGTWMTVVDNQDHWAEMRKTRAKQKGNAGTINAMAANASTINALFEEALGDPSEIVKLAHSGGSFIRKRLRELSFLRKIIPPALVTKEDARRLIQRDGLLKVVDAGPEVKTITWRGEEEEDDDE